MLTVFIDKKDGNVWNISQLVADVTWKTSRIGKAGSLSFTLIKNSPDQDQSFSYANGDIVYVQMKDGTKVFYGYIFSIDGGKDEAVKITCYDQLRYLMASDTYVLANVTASEVVKQIATDFKLKLGRIDDTEYRIPTMSEDNQKLMDIICKALDITLINSGKNYVFFDDFGTLTVRNIEDLKLDFIIGDNSLMTDYSHKVSIDEDTYNRIKLYRDNEDTGMRDTYITQHSGNMAKWGVLQLSQSVDEKMNDAQISEMIDTLIAIKNKETRILKIEAIGDIRVRAGRYVQIIIEEYGINQPFLVDECTHNFDGVNYTMTLDLRVFLRPSS
ncbi:Phage late control gene D protein (GPD) [Desulfitobacterium dehalogenans ATCC 51507]|uniref:Phage late control gene D protein (GPD) n=1 Tax=Desulfitobacterium dehalogenans (strain ATCC 51507 / DSM 9161 / JW/IU-DC1) TaxID=756499 RepID=I4A6E7_DESDJ|nr:hypothetical protein [Desulfitobacterium dehalogenans]AFL99531.1 Phage late control gene D protein (GPD) [Desulfitobacterium dehalogenans ATCC 51507]